jgi:hypothetical protein
MDGEEGEAMGAARAGAKDKQGQSHGQRARHGIGGKMTFDGARGSRHLRRIVAGLQIVGDGDDGEQYRSEDGERRQLGGNSGKQRCPANSALPRQPHTPQGDGDRDPAEIGEEFHAG